MKFILAPMATLSHEAFRRCVAHFGGCDEYFNEMINAPSLLHQGPFEKFYIRSGPEPEKMVWQLTGTTAGPMAEASKILLDLGGIGIDINMGCSAPQIANTGAGISWMLKPVEETANLVRSVKSQIENYAKDGSKPQRLSVKLRLGDEDFTEEGFFKFTDMLVEEGVQMLTLHPRTKKEKTCRPCRWQYVEKLALHYPHIPVILNGGVKDRSTLQAALKASPHAAGFMIARALAQKPWIFKELSSEEPFSFDAEEVALKFIDDVEECQPPEFWKTRLQRFFAYYCLNFSFGHFFWTMMQNAKDNDDARKCVRAYFEKCPDDKIIFR